MKIASWMMAILCPAHLLLASAAQHPPIQDTQQSVGSSSHSVSEASSLTAAPLDLQLLTRRAALIFSGTVITIKLESGKSAGNSSGALVRITFHVDEGIRGVNTGEETTIQEWHGLWVRSGGQRYRTGDRVLVFYHAPSSLGLTSPVSGEAGRFLIREDARVLLTAEQKHALLRSSRLHFNVTDTQILKGDVPYEQLAKMVRQFAAEH